MSWLIQYEDLAGNVFSRTVQSDRDSDGDAVADDEDNCPGVFNPPATRKGPQPDWNDNGVGDACDDSDADGVVDSDDNCRETPNPLQDCFSCLWFWP